MCVCARNVNPIKKHNSSHFTCIWLNEKIILSNVIQSPKFFISIATVVWHSIFLELFGDDSILFANIFICFAFFALLFVRMTIVLCAKSIEMNSVLCPIDSKCHKESVSVTITTQHWLCRRDNKQKTPHVINHWKNIVQSSIDFLFEHFVTIHGAHVLVIQLYLNLN